MSHENSLSIMVLMILVILVHSLHADIPQVMNYQGKITDTEGVPVADGEHTMRFRIYNALTGGDLQWNSTNQTVNLSGGIFSIMLGEIPQPALDLEFDEDYWIEVTFDGVIQTPRLRLGSAGYAYMASGLVPGTTIEGPMTLTASGAIKAVNTGTNGAGDGGYFKTSTPLGAGVRGIGGYYGGFFSSSLTDGIGAIAISTATTGTTYGLQGINYSSEGVGVYGWSTALSGFTYGGKFICNSSLGTGVRGNGDQFGVHGYCESTYGYAVYGEEPATSGTTYGGYFESNSTQGSGVKGTAPKYGVRGLATATDDLAYGGYFRTTSSSGEGVRGVADATSGVTYGVYGRSYSTTDGSRAVYGRSYGSSGEVSGVYGRCQTTDQGFGVYGYATANSGYAYGGAFVSNANHGVCGWTHADEGLVYGAFGYSESTEGGGVYGYAAPTSGEPCGVSGLSRAPDSYAVYGINTSVLPDEYHPPGSYFEHTSAGGIGVGGDGDYAGGLFSCSSTASWAARESYKIVGWGSVSFIQNHPERDDRVIVYAAPEGDEVATYTRGTARLIDGEATVPLGETFKWVTNPDVGLTAHITPRGSWEDLFVKSISTEKLVVGSKTGGGDAMFDYIVYGLRIGFEEQSIVQEKQEEAYIPSMKSHRERYAKYPDLRQYNAFERFKTMQSALGLSHTVDSGASRSLRNAIEEYDPAIHSTQFESYSRSPSLRPTPPPNPGEEGERDEDDMVSTRIQTEKQ